MLLFEVLKAQEKRAGCVLWSTKEDQCPCLRGRLYTLMDPFVECRKLSHISIAFLGNSISPPFAPYTTCHMPNKSFISGQQASSAIPWISFAGFSQKSTPLCSCLPSIRALDMQMWYGRPSPTRQAKQPGLCRALSESTFLCTATHICLASGDVKANIASLFIISTPTRPSFTSDPKLPGSADF